MTCWSWARSKRVARWRLVAGDLAQDFQGLRSERRHRAGLGLPHASEVSEGVVGPCEVSRFDGTASWRIERSFDSAALRSGSHLRKSDLRRVDHPPLTFDLVLQGK
jgi:hypothetical protein